MTNRLTSTDELPVSVSRPAYMRHDLGPGIVHIGLGAFHKAHQAVYTDDALAAKGGDWRIVGASLRSDQPSNELTSQACLYTLIERGRQQTRARVIGSIASAHCLRSDRQSILAALCAPTTRIVSLTVTEKGYGVERNKGGVDIGHPAIAADLANPDRPIGVAGLLVWALGQRRAVGTPPFTILCCDNLPENGRMVRSLLLDFARRVAPDLSEHVAAEVAFPSTMVDRITPAPNESTRRLAEQLTGFEDAAAVECETFRQWVIEDDFPTGRPHWEAGGALFVDDVQPYEDMKLRMLNGAHSMLAYAGFLAGHRYMKDVMTDPDLVKLVKRHLSAAAATLTDLPGVDLGDYADELVERFSNPHLEHETYQIAMDGSEKMPQRIFAPAIDTLKRGQSPEPFAFATAAWMRYTLGHSDDGASYELRDPLEALLRPVSPDKPSAENVLSRICGIPGLVPDLLCHSEPWQTAVCRHLSVMLKFDMPTAIRNASRNA